MKGPTIRRKTKRISKPTGKFRSRFESKLAGELELNGIPVEYETVKLSYQPKPKTYTPDFPLPNGILIEAKGYFTAADRKKALLVREANPDKDVRFVFQNANNRINKRSKTRYRDWCDKHGFLWANGRIPLDWINEDATQES